MVSLQQRSTDLTEGPLLSRIVLYSLPLMLSSMLQLLYNAADSIVVGRFAGTQSLAAVGSTGSMINLTINLFMGMSVGVSVMIAQQIGAHRLKDVSETAHTAVVVSLIAGTLVGLFGFFAARQLLVWMSSPEDVIDLATVYMRIYFLGMPANLLYNFGSSILRAAGDTKRPLYFLSISGLVNIMLNLLLVIVFRMDVAGVAIATVVSQVLSAVLVLLCLLHSDTCYRIRLRDLRIYPDKLRTMIRLGLPAGLQGTIFSLSNILIQSSINSFGSLAVAGNSAASNLDGFIYNGMNSVYHAAITFTGQNVGARKYHRIAKITRICAATVLCIGATISVIIFLLRHSLLNIYTEDPEVIQFGILRLNVMCATYFFCGLMEVMCGQLRGMGKSIVPMIVSVLGVCGVRIFWIYTIFQWDHTLTSLYLSYSVSWAATAGIHFLCYLAVKRHLLRSDAGNAVPETGGGKTNAGISQ